jgi:hypothetical protein
VNALRKADVMFKESLWCGADTSTVSAQTTPDAVGHSALCVAWCKFPHFTLVFRFGIS